MPVTRGAAASASARNISRRSNETHNSKDKNPRLSVTKSGQINGVSKSALIDWLHEEAEVQNSCRSLPFTFVFWLVFIATQLAHRKVQTAYALQTFTSEQFNDPVSAILTDTSLNTTKISAGISLEDVTDFTKLYQWVDQTAIRLTWADERNDVNYISNFDRVLGGIRIQQRRLDTADCPGKSSISDYFKATCYSLKRDRNTSALDRATWLDSAENRTGFAMLNHSAQAAESGTLWKGSVADKDDYYTYWLDVEQSENEALSHTQYLRSQNWLTPATDLVIVQTVLFNSQVARALVARFTFELKRTGRLSSKVQMKVVPVYAYESPAAFVGDVFLVILLLWLAVGECLSLWSKGFKRYLHVYAGLNWTFVIVGIGLCIYYTVESVAMNEIDEKLSKIPATPEGTAYAPGSRNWEDRHDYLNDLYNTLSRRAVFIQRAEVITFWYTLLIVCKFFQAFAANPRLALITDTLLRAMSDLIHFMIVFAVVFLNFAFGAYILFGSQIEGWSSPGKAIISSFRAFIGDFNFSDMYRVHNVSATIWFIAFMFLVFLVMLNMILAIILDIYADVKSTHDRRKTVTEQMASLATGWMLKMTANNPRVNNLWKLQEELKAKEAEDLMLTSSDLAALGLSEAHANKLIKHAALKARRDKKNAGDEVIHHMRSRKRIHAPNEPQKGPPEALPPHRPISREEDSGKLRAAASASTEPTSGSLESSASTLAPPTTAPTAPAGSEHPEMKLPMTPPPDLSKEGLTKYAKDLLQRVEALQESKRPGTATSVESAH